MLQRSRWSKMVEITCGVRSLCKACRCRHVTLQLLDLLCHAAPCLAHISLRLNSSSDGLSLQHDGRGQLHSTHIGTFRIHCSFRCVQCRSLTSSRHGENTAVLHFILGMTASRQNRRCQDARRTFAASADDTARCSSSTSRLLHGIREGRMRGVSDLAQPNGWPVLGVES
jgi:hypothetical protein